MIWFIITFITEVLEISTSTTWSVIITIIILLIMTKGLGSARRYGTFCLGQEFILKSWNIFWNGKIISIKIFTSENKKIFLFQHFFLLFSANFIPCCFIIYVFIDVVFKTICGYFLLLQWTKLIEVFCIEKPNKIVQKNAHRVLF